MTMNDSDLPLTHLLQLAANGERDALDRVFAALYPDLRKIAHARLRVHRDDPMLNTTALVNESFLRFVGASQIVVNDRKHFFAYAARTMRNIIIDLARERLTDRKGNGAVPLELNTDLANQLVASNGEVTLIRVHDALLELEALDKELAQVVEMRYFAGYTENEVSELMGTSERTVRRQWDKARAFLLASLQ
jgi:RNA polymerase sigma factor (TIGR02999 family)